MENFQISRLLDETAFWLEIAGESPFAVRAYATAATTVNRSDLEIAELVLSHQPYSLPGIGKTLSSQIEECVLHGRITFLDDLRKRFPESLRSLLKVPGIGAKLIRLFYEQLGITTLPLLKENCLNGEIQKLPGFGEKRVQKLLEAIAFAEAQQGKYRITAIEDEARALSSFLSSLPCVLRFKITGKLRRFSNVYEKLVFVVLGSDIGQIKAALEETFAGISQSGCVPEKFSFRTAPGMLCEVYVTEDQACWVPLLIETTGSAQHVAALKQLSASKGLLWQSSVLKDAQGHPFNFEKEEAFYALLGIPYCEPVIRENVYLPVVSDTPELLNLGDLKGLVHCHSQWSDGAHSLESMALACRDLGYTYMLITDHSQSSKIANGLEPDRIAAQHQEIDALNRRLTGIRVLKGIESDIRKDGSLDYDEAILRTFDWVIASVHNGLDLDKTEATRRLIRAMENPFTSAIGHPSGRHLLTRPGYELDMEKITDAAVTNKVALEINASPKRFDLDWRHLKDAAHKGARFIISPDAHRITGFQNVRYGVQLARKGCLSSDHILNCLPPEEFMAWQKKP